MTNKQSKYKYTKKYFASLKQSQIHYSKYCDYCIANKTHTAEKHKQSMKFNIAFQRKQNRIKKQSQRGLFGWQVQIFSIRK